MPIKNIIFDFGGVLVDWNPHYLYRKIFPGKDDQFITDFLREVDFHRWNERADCGEPFQNIFEELDGKHAAYAKEIRAYYERFPETLGGPIVESIETLAELKAKKYPLFGLTNWSSETFSRVRDDYPFFSWFQDILVSGEEGLIKPDPAIFQLALQRFRVDPVETLFVDDKENNIDAARRLGLRGHHFRSAQSLRRFLSGEGLL